MYIDCYKYGSKFLYRYFKDGLSTCAKVPYESELFLERKSGDPDAFGFKDKKPLKRFTFDNSKNYTEFRDRYSDNLYGNVNERVQFLSKVRVNKADSVLVKAWAIDIEVFSEDDFPSVEKAEKYPITVITIVSVDGKEKFTWMLDPRNRCSLKSDDSWTLMKFKEESEMLRSFRDFWISKLQDIHVLTGWNSKKYDLPYIIKRMEYVLEDGEKTSSFLSPFGIVQEKTVNGEIEYRIAGLPQLDYMDLFKKFSIKPYPSYKLEDVARVEIKEGKHDHTEFASFAEFYKKDIDKFVKYNIRDAEIIGLLDERVGYISLAVGIATECRINYDDVFSPIRCWEALLYNELKKDGYQFYPRTDEYREEYQGAWVMDPIKGLSRDIMSYDMTSLYPSVIRALNISPEMIIDGAKETSSVESMLKKEWYGQVAGEKAVDPSGSVFMTDSGQGVVPRLMKRLFEERVAANTEKKKKIAELKALEEEK